MIIPENTNWRFVSIPSIVREYVNAVKIHTPVTTPEILPIPPVNDTPPTTQAAIVIVWFIWNKTTFGKNLYAVGGNPEAAAVSGISVFAVTLGAFIMAGILYGFGSWLECTRMVGSIAPKETPFVA